jgi:hypothetical protein
MGQSIGDDILGFWYKCRKYRFYRNKVGGRSASVTGFLRIVYVEDNEDKK